MLLFIIQCIAACAALLACWRVLRPLVIKTELDNLPGPPSHSFLKGNFSKVYATNAWGFHTDIRRKYGGAARVNSVLGDKQLYVSDPKAIHHIVLKDQDIFEETSAFQASSRVLFGEGSILATSGDRHRKQRKMLNPVFSIVNMRQMSTASESSSFMVTRIILVISYLVPIFYGVTHKLGNILMSKLAASGPQEIDVMYWITRASLELIMQSGLGYSIDPLSDDSDVHPYSVAAKQLTPVLFTMIFFRNYLLTTLVKLGPPKFRRFFVDLLPFKNARRMRDIVDTIHNTSVNILETKKRALNEGDEGLTKQAGQGKDIISVLMKANMEASEEDKLLESEILAQISTLTFVAMDTTSAALARILSVLSSHPEVQDRVRQEILERLAKNDGQDLSYDGLVSLPLLDAVCRETLRLYPPVSTVLRTARRNATVPLYTPITGIDGREMHEIVVPKNTTVVISIINCNRDPELWGSDSHEWKPERWLSPLPDTITEAPVPGIYSHLMTFLGGGRACIGFKFSQLEMKVVLSVLLSRFRFAPSDKETVWEMSNLSVPTRKGFPGKPSMPLNVTLL